METMIFRGLQGNEVELEERIDTFLNTLPFKNVRHVTSWTIGIEICVMVIFDRATERKPVQSQPQDVQKITLNQGDY